MTDKEVLDYLEALSNKIISHWRTSLTITVVAVGWLIIMLVGEVDLTLELKVIITLLYLPVILMSGFAVYNAHLDFETFSRFAEKRLNREDNKEIASYAAKRLFKKKKINNAYGTIAIHIGYIFIIAYLIWCSN